MTTCSCSADYHHAGDSDSLCARHVHPTPAAYYAYDVAQYLCEAHADAALPRAEWESAPWLYWGDDRARWPARAGGEEG